MSDPKEANNKDAFPGMALWLSGGNENMSDPKPSDEAMEAAWQTCFGNMNFHGGPVDNDGCGMCVAAYEHAQALDAFAAKATDRYVYDGSRMCTKCEGSGTYSNGAIGLVRCVYCDDGSIALYRLKRSKP